MDVLNKISPPFYLLLTLLRDQLKEEVLVVTYPPVALLQRPDVIHVVQVLLKCRCSDYLPPRNNMILIETPDGFVLADKSVKPVNGDKIAFQIGEFPQLGRLFRTGIITLEGETIDGDGLEGIIVLGKITAEVLYVHEPSRPTI